MTIDPGRTMSPIIALLVSWWRESTDNRWLIDFFEKRSLAGVMRLLIGLCAAAVGIVPVLLLFAPGGPMGIVASVLMIGVTVGMLAWAVRWWCGDWPTPRVSAAFVVWCDLTIAVACAVDTSPVAGTGAGTSFVLIGMYATFFHGPRMLAAHAGWAAAVVSAVALRTLLAPDGGVALALVEFLLALPVVAFVPLLINGGFWLIRTASADSLIDPLTGALNRRGLDASCARILQAANRESSDVIALIVIDLDLFKEINDSLGHAVGDEVLIRTASRIRSVVRSSAVLARTGGEEFALVDVVPFETAVDLAERIRVAIGAPAESATVTASVGVATAPIAEAVRRGQSEGALFDELIKRADFAMYEAKRRGGNAVANGL